MIARVAGAIALGPPIAWAGYTFLRDDELEGYKGGSLAIRSLVCGLVYALLWGIYWFVGYKLFGANSFVKGMEIWQMAMLLVPIMGIGALASFASFDLEPGNGFFHCAMYFAVTVLLRLVAGMPAVPGLVLGK